MKSKSKKWSLVFLVLMIIVMSIIFCSSAQNGTDSGGLSNNAARVFCQLLFSGFDELSADQQALVAGGFTFFLRKSAHFLAYALLGSFSYMFFRLAEISLKGTFLPSVGLCLIFAVTDEVHQYFVPGRSMKATDVVLDCAGAVFGVMLAGIAVIVILHFKNQVSKK